jgi:hypothetical protein
MLVFGGFYFFGTSCPKRMSFQEIGLGKELLLDQNPENLIQGLEIQAVQLHKLFIRFA